LIASAISSFFNLPAESVEDTTSDSAITEYEQVLARMRDALAENLPENREDWCYGIRWPYPKIEHQKPKKQCTLNGISYLKSPLHSVITL